MIEILNLRTHKPTMQYDVRVDRLSPLGNSYQMMSEDLRDEVCDWYTKFFIDSMTHFPNSEFRQEIARLQELYKKHGKLRLFCWCAPKRCHAETIKSWLLQHKK